MFRQLNLQNEQYNIKKYQSEICLFFSALISDKLFHFQNTAYIDLTFDILWKVQTVKGHKVSYKGDSECTYFHNFSTIFGQC